jgi:hypothetical protein
MSGRVSSRHLSSDATAGERVNVAIALAEEACERIEEIAAACRALGLGERARLKGIGVLVGSVRLQDLRRLWSVPEIVAIELEGCGRAR